MGVRITGENWRGDQQPVAIDLKTDLRPEVRARIFEMNLWLESEDCPGAFSLTSDPIFALYEQATFVVRVRFTLPLSAFAFKMKFG